jgi:predicted MFS family arabinose efflux permease
MVTTVGLAVVLMAIISYQLVETNSPIWLLEVSFFLQGAGMANVMPPATNAVMSVLPREHAGAGSALTNTARQVAVALGVAILGSVVASVYRSDLTPHLGALPPALHDKAGGSIGATLAISDKLHLPAGSLADPAHAAFVNAVHTATWVSAAFALFSFLIVLKWMPGKPRKAASNEKAEAPSTLPETVDV